MNDHPQPTSPTLMAEDLDGLAGLFATTVDATPEMIRVFAVHHTLAQLVALGWLVKAPGRWTSTYVPAGGLAERIAWSNRSVA